MSEETTRARATRQATLTVTNIPVAQQKKLRGMLVMNAQAFGLETIRAGFNLPADMPGERDYQYAARLVELLLMYADDGQPITADLLVTLFASSLSERGGQP